MARDIKRNILTADESELAGIKTANSGDYWRKPLEDPEEWLDQSSRWNAKKTVSRKSAVGQWASDMKDRFTRDQSDSSQRQDASGDEGTWQHADREDRARDYREDVSGSGSNTWISILVGLAGGLAATFAMTQAQNAWFKPQQDESSQQDQFTQVDEQSTVKVAQHIAHAADTEIPDDQKQTAGNAVHYSFGTLMGGVYGALSSVMDDAPFGTGILFGVGLWLAADEFVLPYLGLSKPPQERPLQEHAYEASMHAVYGLCLDAVNLIRKQVA